MRTLVSVAVGMLLLSASAAVAQVPTAIEMSLADAAAVFGQAERVPGLEADVKALTEERDALKAQITRYESLEKLDARIAAKEARLHDLDAETIQRQAERIVEMKKERKDGLLSLRVQARAGQGALLGSAAAVIFPPAILIGPVVGGLWGLVEHWLTD